MIGYRGATEVHDPDLDDGELEAGDGLTQKIVGGDGLIGLGRRLRLECQPIHMEGAGGDAGPARFTEHQVIGAGLVDDQIGEPRRNAWPAERHRQGSAEHAAGTLGLHQRDRDIGAGADRRVTGVEELDLGRAAVVAAIDRAAREVMREVGIVREREVVRRSRRAIRDAERAERGREAPESLLADGGLQSAGQEERSRRRGQSLESALERPPDLRGHELLAVQPQGRVLCARRLVEHLEAARMRPFRHREMRDRRVVQSGQ